MECYIVSKANPNFALDVEGESKSDKAHVIIWKFHGKENQIWKLEGTTVNSDINNPKHLSTVPYNYLCIFTYGIGALVTIFVWSLKCRDHTISQILSSYYFSLVFTIFLSSCIKHLVGRARPDTLAVCGGDGSYEQCSSVLSSHELSDQFHSFPSGHAAEAMSVAIFLTLLLTDIWPGSSMMSAIMKMAPSLWATFVSVSRIWDRAHHVDDVIAGVLLGAFVGYFTYRTFKIGIIEEQKIKKQNTTTTDVSASQFSSYI